MSGREIGSVGSLVSAALETSGIYIQSEFLKLFDGGLANTLGMLLFVFSAIAAFFTIAVGGNYKFGRWFLIGPALFYWMVSWQVPTSGAAWKVLGDSESDRESRRARVESVTEGVVGDLDRGNGYRVSGFFVLWDETVSGILQSITTIIESTTLLDRTSVLGFVNSFERSQALSRAKVTDPRLIEFMQEAIINPCAMYFAKSSELHSAVSPVDIGSRDRLLLELEQLGKREVFNLNARPQLVNALKSMGVYDEVKQLGGESQNYSCEQLWKVGLQLTKKHARELIDQAADINRPPDLSHAEAIKLLERKYRIQVDSNDSSLVNFEQDSNQAQLSALVNEVSVRMLSGFMTEVNPDVSAARFTRSPGVIKGITEADAASAYRNIETLNRKEEWTGKGDYLTASLSMPYVQGMGLFFLAATFPFFAFALLIPGRHEVFLSWMSMWVWLKSWDVGFYIVAMIADLLQLFLPSGAPISDEIAGVPGAALIALKAHAPAFSEQTYWSLIATCMLAVPGITGLIVKKGGGEFASTISKATQDLGAKVGGAMSSYQANLMGRELAKSAAQDNIAATQRAASFETIAENPEIMGNMIMGMGGTAAGQGFARFLQGQSGNLGKRIEQLGKEKAGLSPGSEKATSIQSDIDRLSNQKSKIDGFQSISKYALKLSGAAANRYAQVADAQLNTAITEKVFLASISPKQIQYAKDANMLGMFVGTFAQGMGSYNSARVREMITRENFDFKGVADSAVSDTYNLLYDLAKGGAMKSAGAGGGK